MVDFTATEPAVKVEVGEDLFKEGKEVEQIDIEMPSEVLVEEEQMEEEDIQVEHRVLTFKNPVEEEVDLLMVGGNR